MRFGLIITVCLFFCLGALVGILTLFPIHSPIASTNNAKALIGGPFNLIDHNGQPVSEKSYQGKLMLVYFGYSFCPDVCPGDLQVISNAMDILKNKGQDVQPLFITVDPERDTVKQLSAYVPYFHDRLIGLTGSKEQIKRAAKAYRVYYSKTIVEDSDLKYLMNHSSIVYLMDKTGQFLTHFPHGTKPETMAETISKYL